MQLIEFIYFHSSITSQIIRQRDRYHTVYLSFLFNSQIRYAILLLFTMSLSQNSEIRLLFFSNFGIARTFVQIRNKIFRSLSYSFFLYLSLWLFIRAQNQTFDLQLDCSLKIFFLLIC